MHGTYNVKNMDISLVGGLVFVELYARELCVNIADGRCNVYISWQVTWGLGAGRGFQTNLLDR